MVERVRSVKNLLSSTIVGNSNAFPRLSDLVEFELLTGYTNELTLHSYNDSC